MIGHILMFPSQNTGFKDKVVSAGERSTLKLKTLKVNTSEIGIVAKDLSRVQVNQFFLTNTKVPIALFVKKPEFGSPQLSILENFPNNSLLRSLISKDSILRVNGQRIEGIYSSKEVLDKLYGNEFGVKTIR